MNGALQPSAAQSANQLSALELTADQRARIEAGKDGAMAGIPANFNPLEGDVGNFPEACLPLIQLVRNQGQCGSCWAQAVVGALNDKLCIASGGEFRTVLSTTDVTACDTQNGNGCQGGYTGPVIDGFLMTTGVVTGGGQSDVREGDTCYPYYLGGEGENHFHASQSTPPCRSSCYESNYPRGYHQDKYYATERSYHIYR